MALLRHIILFLCRPFKHLHCLFSHLHVPAIHNTCTTSQAWPAITLTFVSGVISARTGIKLLLMAISGGDGNGATSCVDGIAELAYPEMSSLILDISNASGLSVIACPADTHPSSNLGPAYIEIVMEFILSKLGRPITCHL